jgi:DNA-binding IclR family transcriptional regulator
MTEYAVSVRDIQGKVLAMISAIIPTAAFIAMLFLVTI